MSLTFVPSTITITMQQHGQVIEKQVEAVVAEQTGLAYLVDRSSEELHITLTHMPTQTALGLTWGASTEQEAKEWIAILHEVVDWTERMPRFRSGKLGKLLNLIVIGALHEVKIEDEVVL